MSSGCIGCDGSWRHPYSRPLRPSTVRRCRRWPPSTRAESTPPTGPESVSRHVSSGRTGNRWARVMLHRRRKTVVACDTCHGRIHSKRPAKSLTQ
ncbi:hypothetical protein ACIBLA_24020 [Streptomyces sp. NPDC050433]|uniref:HNH endonuclease n=1 Tax=Streptomyces sp. NPDC050433 TaxID=3365615 RepID=UPI003794D27F